MDKRTYYTVVSAIFALICLMHVARLYYGWEAQIGDAIIPLWFSWVGALVAGYLSVRGWQFAKAKKGR